MLPAPRRSSGSTGVRLSITTPSQSPRPLVLSGHLRGPRWRAVQVFDDNCSLNNCLSILCQEALNPCHAVSSVLANIQLPPDRSPRTVGPRSVRMSQQSLALLAAGGWLRDAGTQHPRCRCSWRTKTGEEETLLVLEDVDLLGAPAPHSSKDGAASQSGQEGGRTGGPPGQAPRWNV